MTRRLKHLGLTALHALTPARLLLLAIVGAFIGFLVLGDRGLWQLEKLLHMRDRLLLERQALNDDIDRLSQEKEMLSDPANLEFVIRSELGYIKPGEVIFEERE